MSVRGPSAQRPTLAHAPLGESQYTVKAGDTMWAVARRFDVGLDELVAANPHIEDPNRIKPGQSLTLPNSGARAEVGDAGQPARTDDFQMGAATTAAPVDRQALARSATGAGGNVPLSSGAEVTSLQHAPGRVATPTRGMADAARVSSSDLPLTADKALALAPSTRVNHSEDGGRARQVSAGGARASSRSGGSRSVQVERLEGSQARVTVALHAGSEQRASMRPLGAGAQGATIHGAREDKLSSVQSFTVDLGTAEGKQAYEALARMDPRAAHALADAGAPGVMRHEMQQGFLRGRELGGQGRIRAGNVEVEAGRTESRRVERELSGREHRHAATSTTGAVAVRGDAGAARVAAGRTSGEELHLPAAGTDASRDVPRRADRALGLPEGATWKLTTEGNASVAAERKDAGRLQAQRKRSVVVDATRGAGTLVTVDATVRGARTGEAQATVGRGAEGMALDATVGGAQNREQRVRATLDLARPEHAAAYDGLVRGDAAAAAEIARNQGTLDDASTRARHASGAVTLAESAAVTGTVRASTKREVKTDNVDGSRVEKGAFSADAALATTLGKATLGFEPGRQHSYELSLPAGVAGDVALPTDAARARALPPGARFTLEGEGRVGASVATAQARAGASSRGTLAVEVERRAGEEVDLRVRVAREHSASLEGSVPLGRTGMPSVGLQASRAEQRRQHDVNVRLDLARPDDRAAYDAALKGDTAPAINLASARGQPAPVEERARQDQLGASVKDLHGITVEGSVARDLIPASDSRIQLDDDRRAATQALEQSGRKVEWQERRARGALGADVTRDLPLDVGGSASGTLGLGFSAGKSGSIRMLAPVVDGAAPRAELPTRAEDALALPRGTEVEVVGEGTLGARVKAAIGGPLAAAPGVVLAGSVSVSTSRTETDRFAVTVKRGEGNGASVSITEAQTKQRDSEVGVKVGLTVDPTAVVGSSVVSALPALAQHPIEGALGKVVEGLNDKANIALTHGTSRRTSEERGLELRFEDLTRPEAAQAYAEAVRGRPEAALDLAARARGGEDTGVRMVRGHEEVLTARETHTRLAVGGNVVFLREALRQDRTQVLRTDDGTTTTQASTYQQKSRNILGGRKEMTWEAVSVRTPDDPTGQRFYRMTFDQKDPMTSRGDVARVQRLAEEVGAAPARKMKAEARGGVASLVGAAMGKTRTEMEVFVTPAGMDKVRAASTEEALTAYGRATAAADGEKGLPPWARPEDAAKARAILEQYQSDSPGQRRGDADDPGEKARLEYWHTYKRNIWDDADNYKRARGFASSVDRMRGSDDPGEWSKAFADMGQQTGFHVAGAVGAMNALAGTDEVLVHRLKMSGRRVDIEMKDEGLLEYPQAQTVQRAQAPGMDGP